MVLILAHRVTCGHSALAGSLNAAYVQSCKQ